MFSLLKGGELFGTQETKVLHEQSKLQYLEKTVEAESSISSFNDMFGTKIESDGCETFAELIEKNLGRHPTVGDTLNLESLEVIVKETSLFKAKESLSEPSSNRQFRM